MLQFPAIRPVIMGFAVAILSLGSPAAKASDALITINAQSDSPIALSRSELEAMPSTTFETSTIWTEGKHRFTGVALAEFIAALSLTGDTITAKALNDYSVEIPMSDAVQGGPIIAYFMNDEPLSVRDKGPLWIVYPYDAEDKYQTEVIYSRSIWQLNRIDVIE